MMVDMGTADPTLDKYVGCKPQCTKASLLCIILIRVKIQVKQKKKKTTTRVFFSENIKNSYISLSAELFESHVFFLRRCSSVCACSLKTTIRRICEYRCPASKVTSDMVILQICSSPTLFRMLC